MTRRVEEATRTDLLDRVLAYALANGIASLSLRALAKELDVSPGSLLYHFHSKEELTVEILKRAGDQQRELFAELRVEESETEGDACRAVWRVLGAPESRPLFKLFFEVYGLALVDPDRFPDFFLRAIDGWLDFLAAVNGNYGMSKREARSRATVVLAGFRGFLLDLCATGDQKRVDRAVELWIEMLA